MISCEICTKDESKYKCPNCSIKYCSKSCWNVHKEAPCERPANPDIVPAEPKPVYYPTADTVDPAKLDRLRQSEGLKEILKNPHLRNLLREVDTADNAWKAVSAAMTEPLFLEFADEVLKVIEPDPESEPHLE